MYRIYNKKYRQWVTQELLNQEDAIGVAVALLTHLAETGINGVTVLSVVRVDERGVMLESTDVTKDGVVYAC